MIRTDFIDSAGEGANEQYRPSSSTIHQMHESERPREKALSKGFGSLTAAELWALVLRNGVKGLNVIDMCREMMSRNDNNLVTLSRRNLRELTDIKGMGESKAIQVMAVLELSRRLNKERLPESPCIRSGEDVYDLMRHEIAHLPQEEIWVLYLDRQNNVRKTARMSIGGSTASVVDVKMILKDAILEQAQSLILCHNHPSGSLRPSVQDDQVTGKMKEGCKAVDIRMLDHVIVTSSGYFSYADNGKL